MNNQGSVRSPRTVHSRAARIGRWAGGAAVVAALASQAGAQLTNRLVRADDIQVRTNPDGTSTVRVRALLSNATSTRADLSATLAVAINGVPLGSVIGSVMVDGGGSCMGTCSAQPGCVACVPSMIPGVPCLCYSRVIDSPAFTVPALREGDVVSATITAIGASVREEFTGDDWAFKVIPRRLHHNRALNVSSLRYEPSPAGTFMITGEVDYQTTFGGSVDLGNEVEIYSGGILIGGGHSGGGGSCGSTNLITMGNGSPMPGGPNGQVIFTCVYFCQNCHGYDVNVCIPMEPSPFPFCECHQYCAARIVPGPRWVVEVPPLEADTLVTVRLAALPGSEPEIDTSDDEATVRIGDISPGCPADYNQDGGIDGSDVGAFFEDWEAGSQNADVNRDGGIDGADVNAFFEHWEAGC